MNNTEIKQQYIDYIKQSKIQENGKKERISIINQYFVMLDISQCAIQKSGIPEIEQFLLQKRHLKTSTVNKIISVIKKLYLYLSKEGLLEKDCLHLIKLRPKGKQLPRNISHSMMIKLCTPTEREKQQPLKIIDLRNQAIIEFLYATGIRSAELRSLRIKQLSPDLCRCWIITQKAGVDRMVFLNKYARVSLYLYLQARGINCKSLEAKQRYEYVFPSQGRKMMSSQTLKNIVRDLAVERISAPVTPHMIRHTFATDMLRSYGCLRTLQKFMGHRNINSTAWYCHLTIADKIKAINNYHPRNTPKGIDNKNKKG